jgi:hypothetical protein
MPSETHKNMNPQSLDQIRTWVAGYVDGFRQASASLPPALALKLEHSRYVAENARDIARDLGWDAEDVCTAEALGWLHDVGRFSQFAEFGHFHDATSVDHGRRGLEIIQESDILALLPENRRRCLMEGIRHHNARTIPATLTPACLPLLKLIRDADKLDIYRVVSEGLARDGFRDLADMWPHVDLQGPVNPLILHDIRTRHTGDVAHVRSLSDFLLLQASWICGLNYVPTLKRVRGRGILETIAAHLPDDPAVQKVIDEIRNYLSDEYEREQESRTPCHSGHQ